MPSYNDEQDIQTVQQYDTFMNSEQQQQLRHYRIENSKELTPLQWQQFEQAMKLFPKGPNANKQIAQYMNCDMHANHVPQYRYRLRKMKRRL